MHQVLIRRGLVIPRPRPTRDEGRRFQRPHSNDLWQIDGTEHRLVNGRQFWVVDILDDRSRFLLAALVGLTLTGALAWEAMRIAVAAYGLPRQLLSDNGTTFTGKLHGFVVYFERQVRAAGIDFINGRVRHPQTQGKIERQHQTQNEWIADHRPHSIVEAQHVIHAYRADYDTVRPHEALGQLTPAEVYLPGTPLQLPPIDLEPADPYPAGALRRHIDPQGRIRYGHHTLTVERRWADLPVGLSASTAAYPSSTAAPRSPPSSSATCHTHEGDQRMQFSKVRSSTQEVSGGFTGAICYTVIMRLADSG